MFTIYGHIHWMAIDANIIIIIIIGDDKWWYFSGNNWKITGDNILDKETQDKAFAAFDNYLTHFTNCNFTKVQSLNFKRILSNEIENYATQNYISIVWKLFWKNVPSRLPKKPFFKVLRFILKVLSIWRQYFSRILNKGVRKSKKASASLHIVYTQSI